MSLNISYGGYVHQQATAATTWNITHNLGCKPVVDVFISVNGDLTKVIPQDVVFPDNLTCTITFSAAQSGEARCV